MVKKQISKKIFIYFLSLLSFLFFFVSCNSKASSKSSEPIETDTSKPNIIVILIDDAGYADFGFMGSKDLKTPQIDKLAKSGVVLTDAHVSASVCAPSRAGLITGMYQQRFGFEANGTGDENTGDIGLSEDVQTMATVFKKNNYKTIAIGKWHLGASPSDHPNQRGFDEFYGFLAGGRSYFPIQNPSRELMLQQNGKQVKFDGYLTDELGNRSVQFIEENKNHPFFMYLAYNAVHTPMEAKEVDLMKFKDHPRRTLAAMTWSLDENIGKLQRKLEELNLLDNTLIYFLSDNGGAHNNDSNNEPLKGWKGNEFEGGHRVPFIVSWKSKIKPDQTYDGLSSSLDIFTTSLAAANIPIEDTWKLDGMNLLPYLTGQKKEMPNRKLFWRKLDESAVRIGNLKMINLKNYGAVMYDLSKDLDEVHDLSLQDTTAFNRLNNSLSKWESNLMKPLWGEGQPWEEVTYYIHQRLMENKPALYKSPSEKQEIISDK